MSFDISFKDSIKNRFEKYGVSTKDVAKALLSFKALSLATYCGTLALCYRYRPLKKLSQVPRIRDRLDYAMQNYPWYIKANSFIKEKSKKLAESRFFKPIPANLGLKSKRFTMAIAENVVISKILLPITLPLHFWIIVHLYKRKDKDLTSDDYIIGTIEAIESEEIKKSKD